MNEPRACLYCRRPLLPDARSCPACAADLSVGPTALGLAGLGGLFAAYASAALALYGWCYRPTGWLHAPVDGLVRGDHALPAGPPFSSDPLLDVIFQLVLPLAPAGLFVAALLLGRRGTSRGGGGY